MKVSIIINISDSEKDISIKSAKDVYYVLSQHYTANIVVLNSDKQLIVVDDNFNSIENFKFNVDAAFLCCHGKNGEDGCLQTILDSYNIPYTSPNALSSRITFDKFITKKICEYNDVGIVKYILYNKYLKYDVIVKDLGNDLIIKPCNCGSSFGVNHCHSKHEYNEMVQNSLQYDSSILIEQKLNDFIEVQLGIIEINNEMITGKMGQIICESFYSSDIKYNGNINYTFNITINENIQHQLLTLSKKLWKVFNLNNMARFDFFIANDVVYLNEINTIPGLTKKSIFPNMFNYTYDEFILNIVENIKKTSIL
jgi:D-alanine-D-alanine ligase